MKTIAVIGGGITGITTAYALSKRGFAVTLFEKHRYAAMETSFANGGQLSASNAEVWNHWSTIVKGLKWMLKSDAPLLVNPKPSWHKLSWFAEFIASIPSYNQNTIETARLAVAAREHLFAWAEAEGIDFDLKKKGILHIYRDKAGSSMQGGFPSCWPKAACRAAASRRKKCAASSPPSPASTMAVTLPSAIPPATSTSSPTAWQRLLIGSACAAFTIRT